MDISVPQDRNSSFEPQVVKKRQKDISAIDDKIISMYAKGMTTRQISDMIEDIYGFEVSEGMVSDITDRLLPEIESWQPISSLESASMAKKKYSVSRSERMKAVNTG